MIERVHLQNFKSLNDVNVGLERLTLLVGPNGAGKSSVLQGLAFASVELDPDQVAFNDFAGDAAQPIRVDMFAGTATRKSWWEVADGQLHHTTQIEQGSAHWKRTGKTWRPEGPAGPLDPAVPDAFRCFLLDVEPKKLVMPSRAEATRAVIEASGEGLASHLSYIAGFDPDAFKAISDDLRAIVPGAQSVRVEPTSVPVSEWEVRLVAGQLARQRVTSEETGHRLLVRFTDGRTVRGELLSEGTAVALAIITLLHSPQRPALLLIDDLDRGLHFEAQVELVTVLRRFLDLDPNLQIVCTTHSPFLLDQVKPEEVRVLALGADRATRVRPLVDHPEYERWRFGTQTGGLWAALGERWVAETSIP